MKPHALHTAELDYELPQELIATQPVQPRDSARMMVLWRSNDRIEHRQVRDLPEYLGQGDVLAFNNTAVTPARLIGRRTDTAGKVEGLYLNDEPDPASESEVLWRLMLKAGGKLRPGITIEWLTPHGAPSQITIELLRQIDAEWVARLNGASTEIALEEVGWTPLPPYILQARGNETLGDELDRQWYQTVFADLRRQKSVAAPTAGLHFTPALLSDLDQKGIERLEITLHVGPGTFKPITAATLDQHRMHSEWLEVDGQVVTRLRALRNQSLPGRVIAVGTTAVRTLESLPSPLPEICGPIAKMTDLLIAPPYEFKLVDGMLTNFHLPRSTLMALVAAMLDRPSTDREHQEARSGLQRLKFVYREAIERGYRFYSYGDAMLILP